MERKILSAYTLSLDDVGHTKAITERALELIGMGVVDRISVMMQFEDLAAVAATSSDVAKDIHLHFHPKIYAPSFIGALTCTFDRLALFVRIHLDPSCARNIASAWESQIQSFITVFGSTPDGINTHEHIHFIPRLYPHVVQLALEYNIPYIRMGSLRIESNDYRERLLSLWRKKNIIPHQLTTSSGLYSYDWKRLSIPEIESQLPAKTELIFHPQYEEDYAFLRTFAPVLQ